MKITRKKGETIERFRLRKLQIETTTKLRREVCQRGASASAPKVDVFGAVWSDRAQTFIRVPSARREAQ